MPIDLTPIKNDYISSADRPFLSKSKSGIGALIQRVSNSVLWKGAYSSTGFACVALIPSAAYVGAKVISSVVDDINDLLAPCESLSLQIYREVTSAGVMYGLSAGTIIGLSIAAVIRRGINLTHGSDLSRWNLLIMGAFAGLSFGSFTGMLYSVYLQKARNIDGIEEACRSSPYQRAEF